MLIQDSVGWSERGSATASNIFSRNLGSTLGATVLGVVLNTGLAHGGRSDGVSSDQLRQLLATAKTQSVADPLVRAVLEHALHLTFVGIFVISVITVLVAWLVPNLAIVVRDEALAE